jgi:hypothetical protein
MIQDSFKKTGIFPVDYYQILRNCTTFIHHQHNLLEINAKIPKFVDVMAKQGEIKDHLYQKLCPQLPKPEKPKDLLVPNRRRSLILTNHLFIQNEYNKAAAKEAKKAATPKRKRSSAAENNMKQENQRKKCQEFDW